MPEPHEKDEHPEMLNDHAHAVARWLYQTIEDMDKKSIFAPPKEGVRYRCPCCRYRTLEERGATTFAQCVSGKMTDKMTKMLIRIVFLAQII